MWRKVNQGLSSTTSTVFKQSTARGGDNSSGSQQRQPLAIVDDGPVYANVPQHNKGWGYIDTTKCRKRRRKVKGRRNRYAMQNYHLLLLLLSLYYCSAQSLGEYIANRQTEKSSIS